MLPLFRMEGMMESGLYTIILLILLAVAILVSRIIMSWMFSTADILRELQKIRDLLDNK